MEAKEANSIANSVIENNDKAKLDEIFDRIRDMAKSGEFSLNIYHKEEPFTFRIAEQYKGEIGERGFGIKVYGEQKDADKPYVEIRWDKDE